VGEYVGSDAGLAALLFLISGLAGSMRQFMYYMPSGLVRALGAITRFLQPLYPQAGGKRLFVQGALLGFMPCGLIYAMLLLAASTANPFVGAVAMAIFVVGTMPALMLLSAGADWLSQRYRTTMRQIGRVAMAFNAITLLILADKLIKGGGGIIS